MDAVEGNIRQLLNGSSLEEEVLCDFTLADQNEAIGNNGILLTPWAGFPQATDGMSSGLPCNMQQIKLSKFDRLPVQEHGIDF